MLKYTSYMTTLSPEAEITIITTNAICPSEDMNVITSNNGTCGSRMFQACHFAIGYGSNGKQYCVFRCQCESDSLICHIYFHSLQTNLELCEIIVKS